LDRVSVKLINRQNVITFKFHHHIWLYWKSAPTLSNFSASAAKFCGELL
jgi:hypothetical protein